MKSQSVTRRNSAANRFKAPDNIDRAARHVLLQRLVWIWGTSVTASLLAIDAVGNGWPSYLPVIAGVFITFSLFRRAQTRRPKLAPLPHLSAASKCVWQMDREA
jgi:hypothetical protein